MKINYKGLVKHNGNAKVKGSPVKGNIQRV